MNRTNSNSSRQVRTSLTHPLRIDMTPAGDAGGQIGITFCPGKKGDSNSSHVWRRDLTLDLDAIVAWQAAAVVTLIEDHEFKMLEVTELGSQTQARGVDWHHLPIQDVKPPGARFEATWLESGPKLLAHLRAGRRVLVHCRGGLGRAGTVAARLLVELGAQPRDAVDIVRRARPGAIETAAQKAYVLGLGSIMAAKSERPGHPEKPTQIRANPRDWFERLTGFQETSYDDTRSQLEVAGQQLRSRVTGHSYGIGRLELPTLGELRQRAESGHPVPGHRQVTIIQGEARQLHGRPEFAGSLIQVASQFNLLEMVSENVSPEQGVTRYVNDRTQGPACAIAAGAATIYRNYFAPVGEASGQTSTHQLDGFASLGEALAQAVDRPSESLWSMRNGYSMFKPGAVGTISQCLRTLDAKAIDALRSKLRIGLHWDVDVTDGDALPRPQVSQAFCSALPVSYNHRAKASADDWKPFASLVLEAAYESTLWAAVANAQRHGSETVLLTMLGGGAFGNDEAWIHAAMRRAIEMVANHGLNIVFVSYGAPSAGLLELAKGLA